MPRKLAISTAAMSPLVLRHSLVSGAIAVGVGDEDLVSALMEFVLVL